MIEAGWSLIKRIDSLRQSCQVIGYRYLSMDTLGGESGLDSSSHVLLLTLCSWVRTRLHLHRRLYYSRGATKDSFNQIGSSTKKQLLEFLHGLHYNQQATHVAGDGSL